MLTGYVFAVFDGQTAFYLVLIPILIIMITLRLLKGNVVSAAVVII